MSLTQQVHAYWNAGSCGTGTASSSKHSRAYFEEIERFRYKHEPCIPVFARFDDWRDRDVLEVGVGAGTDFLQFARAGARVNGVDLTEEAIENTGKRLAFYGLAPASLQSINAERLPFADESFDLVWSWGVIHHADDTEACLREIARVARRGDTVRIMLYNYDALWTWFQAVSHGTLDRAKAMRLYQESPGTKAFTERAARDMAARCGLTVQAVTYADQLIREGAKLERLRRGVQRHTPFRRRWYMMLDMTK